MVFAVVGRTVFFEFLNLIISFTSSKRWLWCPLNSGLDVDVFFIRWKDDGFLFVFWVVFYSFTSYIVLFLSSFGLERISRIYLTEDLSALESTTWMRSVKLAFFATISFTWITSYPLFERFVWRFWVFLFS